jgi:hypothetical protein
MASASLIFEEPLTSSDIRTVRSRSRANLRALLMVERMRLSCSLASFNRERNFSAVLSRDWSMLHSLSESSSTMRPAAHVKRRIAHNMKKDQANTIQLLFAFIIDAGDIPALDGGVRVQDAAISVKYGCVRAAADQRDVLNSRDVTCAAIDA